MLKKTLIVAGVVIVAVAVGLSLWVRAVLAGDAVRAAVARQLGGALGQPVDIGGVTAGLYPRVTMTLEDVRIGNPARVHVARLHVGTALGALLSRRIEHAALRVDTVRIELPLPPLALGGASARPQADDRGAPPVELVSIDEIVLRDVEIVSGGRTLHGGLELLPREGGGLEVRQVELTADGTTLEITGEITDLAGPTGDLALDAGNLDVDALMAFLSEFSAGTAPSAAPGASASADGSVPRGLDLGIAVAAEHASFGQLTIDGLAARGRLTPAGVSLDPITFGLFGGRYDGSLGLAPGNGQAFTVAASVSGVDMAAVSAFAGTPELLTGRLAGALGLEGRGTTADAVLQSTHGTARIDVTDGTVKGLGLVRAVVLATSMRDESKAQLGTTTVDEPFSRLGATLRVANGVAATEDLRFEAPDLTLTAAGSVALDGSTIDIEGRVQLSAELTSRAGRDLARYTSDDGRVTLPVTITGTAERPQVRIDMAGLAERAITNKAKEELNKAIERNLPGVLRR